MENLKKVICHNCKGNRKELGMGHISRDCTTCEGEGFLFYNPEEKNDAPHTLPKKAEEEAVVCESKCEEQCEDAHEEEPVINEAKRKRGRPPKVDMSDV